MAWPQKKPSSKNQRQETPKGLSLSLMSPKNHILQIQSKFKEMETGFKTWVSKSKQPLVIETAVATATGAIQGGFVGAIIGVTTNAFSRVPMSLGSSVASHARNFAVIASVHAGISCALKRYVKANGNGPLVSNMIAAFGSGAAIYPLAFASSKPIYDRIGDMMVMGLLFAAGEGLLYELGAFYNPIQLPEDPCYKKTRSMLTKLGLQRYERSFRREEVDDSMLPVLNNTVLKEMFILSIRERLLILDHIRRDPELGVKNIVADK